MTSTPDIRVIARRGNAPYSSRFTIPKLLFSREGAAVGKERTDYSQFPLVGDTPESLAALVDQVLRGEVIMRVRLRSLRALIEAMQAHPAARLAPPKENRGKEWRPPRDNDPNALPRLHIEESEILDGDYQALDVRVTLSASARFAQDARFGGAAFQGEARFDKARFQQGVSGNLRVCFLRTAKYAEAARQKPEERSEIDPDAPWRQRTQRWFREFPGRSADGPAKPDWGGGAGGGAPSAGGWSAPWGNWPSSVACPCWR